VMTDMIKVYALKWLKFMLYFLSLYIYIWTQIQPKVYINFSLNCKQVNHVLNSSAIYAVGLS